MSQKPHKKIKIRIESKRKKKIAPKKSDLIIRKALLKKIEEKVRAKDGSSRKS